MDKISVEKYKKLIKSGAIKDVKKKSKYRSKRVFYDNNWFDSIKERDYYIYLKGQKKSHKVQNFAFKQRFELQPTFISCGTKIRAITIIPDFIIYHLDGVMEICDTKGYSTKDWQIKWKMLKYKFKDNKQIIFTVI